MSHPSLASLPPRGVSAAALALALACGGCQETPEIVHPWTERAEDGPATPTRTPVARWREDGLGLRIRFEPQDPATAFRAEGFDAAAWARLAREAGLGYAILGAKGANGFCLFDSAHTEFDSAEAPGARDLVAEFVAAARAEGLGIGLAYSIRDEHHPDYRAGGSLDEEDRASFERYSAFVRDQVRELLTKYGPIDVLWFENEEDVAWSHRDAEGLVAACRELRPETLLSNRVDKGRAADGSTVPGFLGDFATPTEGIPDGVEEWEEPWECLVRLPGGAPADANDPSAGATTLIRRMIDAASRGGNLLLEVEARDDGGVPPETAETLRRVGAWMSDHAGTVRGALPSPIPPFPWGRATYLSGERRRTLLLHVFDWPADGQLLVPGLGNDRQVQARLADRPGASLRMKKVEDGLLVYLPLTDRAPDAAASTLVLDFGREPIFYSSPVVHAEAAVFTDALEVELASNSPRLAVHYTLDGSEPTKASMLYRKPIVLEESATLRARSFDRDRPVASSIERRFERQLPLAAVEPPRLETGLWRVSAQEALERLPAPSEALGGARTPVAGVELLPTDQGAAVHYRYEGYFHASSAGVWHFALRSDDGARLTLGNRIAIEPDTEPGLRLRETAIALEAGWHPFVVEGFNAGGFADLHLEVTPPSLADGSTPTWSFGRTRE